MQTALPKVYVVDDDPLILESLSQLLEGSGFDVVVFDDSTGFLASDIQAHDSCLVLDLSMPGVSGLELQQSLRNKGVVIPIIIHSGVADVKSAVKAMEGGAVTLLQKPVDISVLINTIKNSIESHSKHSEVRANQSLAKQKLSVLTKRESAIASMVANGLSASEIAQQLFISNRTVEAHKSNIFSKLGINSVAQLTQLVIRAEALEA